MPGKYTAELPQLQAGHGPEAPPVFFTEGGIETTLIFRKGWDLPHFASFPLLASAAGRQALWDCYLPYIDLARRFRTGIVLETVTWRANAAWIRRMGLAADGDEEKVLVDANRAAAELLLQMRDAYETPDTPIVISGNLGPLGDAYRPDALSPTLPGGAEQDGDSDGNKTAGRDTNKTGGSAAASPRLAYALAAYRVQVASLAATGADQIGIMTVTDVDEAVAAVLLARDAGLPVWVSFSVETDGRLADERRSTIDDFVAAVDAATDGYAAYFGLNCAHPAHVLPALRGASAAVRARIREVRANASTKSHAELDESTDLDRGHPPALGLLHRDLAALLPRLCVVGGCCGTDEEHVCEMATALAAP